MKAFIKKFIPSPLLKLLRKSNTAENSFAPRFDPLKHKGDDVKCNICGATYSTFGTFGIVPRHNAYCFNCGSLERHRILWKFLNEETGFLKSGNIRLLHIAPEKSFYHLFDDNPQIEYTAADLNPENYKNYGLSKVVESDITNLPFEENSFDLIICNHVLEHIPDDIKAMKELFRVMKTGGTGIFMIPINCHPKPSGFDDEVTYEDFTINTGEGRLKAFGQDDHVRVYGNDYAIRLRSVGFNYYEFDYTERLSAEDLFRLGISNGDVVQYCTKS